MNDSIVLLSTMQDQMAALLAPSVPPQVTRFQAREVLRQAPSGMAGKSLFDVVDAYMQEQGGEALRAWEEVGVFVRASPLVQSLGEELDLTEDQVDDLFRLAASIAV